ncbi:hypothetical protein JY96_00740 [Aquabacterium sp. NJ1]|nr:hypothetical protein JY96_00740 [Aquabacterium sp. NJ1]
MTTSLLVSKKILHRLICLDLSLLGLSDLSDVRQGSEAQLQLFDLSSCTQPRINERLPLPIPIGKRTRLGRRHLTQRVVHYLSRSTVRVVPLNRYRPSCVTQAVTFVAANYRDWCTSHSPHAKHPVVNSIPLFERAS